RVIHERDATLAARAEHAATLRVRRVAVDLVDAVADALDRDATAPRTHVADAVRRLDLATIIPGRLCAALRRGDCGDRMASRHRQAGASRQRTLQESAA